MIKDFQIKGLEKLINSSAIKDIYPMVDHIEINHDEDFITQRGNRRIDVDIFLALLNIGEQIVVQSQNYTDQCKC